MLEANEIECLKGSSPICLALLREMKLFLWNVTPGAEDVAPLEMQKSREIVGLTPQHHSKEVCWCPPAVPELRWRQEDQKLQVILGFILEAELRYTKTLPQKIFFFILKFILYVCSIFIQCLESSPGPRICPASVLPLSYMPSPALPITGENHKPFSVTNEWMGGQV